MPFSSKTFSTWRRKKFVSAETSSSFWHSSYLKSPINITIIKINRVRKVFILKATMPQPLNRFSRVLFQKCYCNEVVFKLNLNLEIIPPQQSLNLDIDKLTLNKQFRWKFFIWIQDHSGATFSNSIFKCAQKQTNSQLSAPRLFKSVKRLRLGCVRKRWG